MAISQSFLLADCSTSANYKAWGSAISTALTSATCNWAKSGDTGQVAWASVSSVPAITSGTHYEVWVMNDTSQGTNPVFMKIEYGYGNATAYPAIAITVGSGSNGTGALTNAGTRNILGPWVGSGGTSTTYECDFSGSTNRFAMTLFRGYTYPSFFSIERSHDTNGNDTTSYVTYLAAGYDLGAPYCYQQTIMPSANGGPLYYEKYGLTMQTNSTTAMFANSVAVTPFWPFVGKIDNPLLGAVCVKSGDFTDGAELSVTMYSNPHNYLVSKPYSSTTWGNQATNAIAMRFE